MAGDRIFGVVMALVALTYMASALQIQAGFLSDPVGSKTFPLIIGGVALLCSVIMIIGPDPEPDWPSAKTFGELAIAAVVLIAYAYALKPLGFLVPTAIASGVISYMIARRPVYAAIAGVCLSIGLFALFKYALGLNLAPLPKALLG
jgi:putative tricarboxylic transport membrane protein